MSDDDLPPPRQQPGAPGFLWLLLGLVLIVVFVVVLKIMHPSEVGLGVTPSPLQAVPVKP